MNALVEKLSKKKYAVIANRPDTSAESLKHRIALKYVHICFEETGTEIGMQLDMKKCDLSGGDFEKGHGGVHLEGVLTLNYDKVRCIADIDLHSMTGNGCLEMVDERTYAEVLNTR